MTTRVSLFDRLPAIHKINDAALAVNGQPGPLQAYLSHLEDVFSDVKGSIDALYHDLFIETCAAWVIPYIGDLLGTSPLSGAPWTLRADVADTIALRRAKGTLAAIQQLAFDLTEWGVHPVELRRNLAWAQALNHQRPDRGGAPAYATPLHGIHTVIRGGFATIRDPATLSLIGTPYDHFARFADVSIPTADRVAYNLPNLAIFVWRLAAYHIQLLRHVATPTTAVSTTGLAAPAAGYVARFYADPLARPVQLFGLSTYDPDRTPPVLTPIDGQPAPIAPPRLTTPTAGSGGNPGAYVAASTYPDGGVITTGALPIEIYVPASASTTGPWTFRGANLCAWEAGLAPPLQVNEIAIDPVIGRIAIGAATQASAQAMVSGLALSYTYGAVGNVGGLPDTRDALPTTWLLGPVPAAIVVDHSATSPTLAAALATLATTATAPLVIEIDDDELHDLDVSTVTGAITENGTPNLACGRPLFLRSAPNRRPIIRLAQSLRFRPTAVVDAVAAVANTTVRIDGITFVPGTAMAATDPLIARAAIHELDLRDCTLAPGGDRVLDGTSGGARAPSRIAMKLDATYDFAAATDAAAFAEEPAISLTRCIAGPLYVDTPGYTITLTSSIIDAGPSTGSRVFALSGTGDPSTALCAATVIDGVTVFGAARVAQVSGQGGIFTDQLYVDDNQRGCLKLSWFSNNGDRLPQHSGCLDAASAPLAFTSEIFGAAAYGQLSRDSDPRILDEGPNADAMGAFGFLLEAHKWKNLSIRLRELTPAGVRALVIPAT